MKAGIGTMLGGATVAMFIVAGLAACTVGSDGGGPSGPDDTATTSRQQPPSSATAPTRTPTAGERAAENASPHPYVGMWVTADGHIRQELLANGRYDEARGERESAYTGSYRVSGNRIDYKDDTGFSADGTFDGDVLHHGGYLFYREGSDAHRQATQSP